VTDAEGISAHARRQPDKPALILGDTVRTFGALGERTNRLAHALRDLGMSGDHPVAAMLPNSYEFFEVALATSRLGVPFLGINWHLLADEVAWILADSGAEVLVTHQSLSAVAEPALAQAPACRSVVVGGNYEDVLDSVDAGRPELSSTATWVPVFYTSGTTGRPKGVIHGQLQPAHMAVAQQGQIALWSWTPDDIHLLSGPAYHAGPGGWTMTALTLGATTVILPAWDARAWLGLVARHRVTRSFMVPSHFIRILEVPAVERAEYDLSSLRLIVHGAAPCPDRVKREIMAALAPGEIWELYGASEGGATRIGPAEWMERPGSVGLPWPGVEIHVLDDDGHPLEPGETGQIYVLPPGGARFHYHDDPAKTASAWREQGFTVGDVGHVDEDGYLFITDRATDMIIRGGVNIYPREIEEVLYRHPAVVDCAVFGIPDDRDGEHVKAVIEVRSAVTASALQDHVRESLSSYKVPQAVDIVDRLPRDPSGKVLKRLLRDAHWQGRSTAVG
jgi:long-chain acyl-CoA synthetase